jgi:hypothetical protein
LDVILDRLDRIPDLCRRCRDVDGYVQPRHEVRVRP